MLGAAVNNAWLQQVDLARSIELIFGIILVLMMLFRRAGPDPGDAPHRRPQFLRAARDERAARRVRRGAGRARAGRAAAGRRQPARSARRHRALRRTDGAERRQRRRAGRRRGRGDRAERLGQVHAVQRHHRPGSGERRQHPLRRRGDRRPAAAPGAGARAGPHVPEHPAVQQSLGAGQRHDRPARAARHRHDRRDPAPAAHPRGGARRLSVRARHPDPVRQPPAAARDAAGRDAVLRQPPPRGDRPRARHAVRGC